MTTQRPVRPWAFSLIEILVGVTILAMLAPAVLSMRSQSQKALATLPNRLFALYYAFDLMEERLALPFSRVNSISERKASDFVWIKKNIERLRAELTGEARARVELSAAFLDRFVAGVKVTSVPPDRKKLRVTIKWKEQGIERQHILDGEVRR